jgi:hypothetical protein
MRDARRRGDLLTETSMRRVRNIAWLALGRPDRALRDLKRAAWIPPEGRFHLQHWYELESLGELALFRGHAAEAFDKYREQFDALSSSLLIRIQIVRAVSNWLRGRLALAAAETADEAKEHLAVARTCARRVEKEDAAYARVWGPLLRAGIATQEGDIAAARALLNTAAAAARREHMADCVAAANYRLAQFARGEEGDRQIAEAADLLRDKGVVATERRVQVIAPGFRRE